MTTMTSPRPLDATCPCHGTDAQLLSSGLDQDQISAYRTNHAAMHCFAATVQDEKLRSLSSPAQLLELSYKEVQGRVWEDAMET